MAAIMDFGRSPIKIEEEQTSAIQDRSLHLDGDHIEPDDVFGLQKHEDELKCYSIETGTSYEPFRGPRDSIEPFDLSALRSTDEMTHGDMRGSDEPHHGDLRATDELTLDEPRLTRDTNTLAGYGWQLKSFSELASYASSLYWCKLCNVYFVRAADLVDHDRDSKAHGSALARAKKSGYPSNENIEDRRGGKRRTTRVLIWR